MEKQNFNIKIYEACSDDELRPIMMCVHFINGFAYASEGHIAVKQSLEYHSIINPEVLNGKSIHRDNFKNIMQFEIAECTESGVVCKDSDGRTALFDYFDRKGEKIPDFEKVMQAGDIKEVRFIGLNFKLVEKLQKAMHSPSGNFRLRFHGNDKGIIIDVADIPNQVAIAIPCLIEEGLF